MKIQMKLIIALAVVAGVMTGCKKGENDPFFSFKSRKARLAGSWVISELDVEEKSHWTDWAAQEYNSVSTRTYDGARMVHSWTDSQVGGATTSGSEVYAYKHELEFTKEGTFVQTFQGDDDGDNIYDWTFVQSGNWVFVGKNKEAELKNKEAVALYVTSETSTGSYSSSSTFTGFQNSQILVLDRLAKDELVVKYDESELDGSSGDSSSMTGTETFVKE